MKCIISDEHLLLMSRITEGKRNTRNTMFKVTMIEIRVCFCFLILVF